MRFRLLVLAIGLTRAAQAQERVPDSMAVWIATYPDRARDSIRTWLSATTKADSVTTFALLAQAEQMGAVYVLVWGDSFPLLDARRFAGWSLENRSRRIRADSLRRAGNAALGRLGFTAALRDWRASYQLARALGDTATMAAALGNIGAGFYRATKLDSATWYFTRARLLAGLAGDRRTMMNALGGLASVNKNQGDLRTAAAQYTEALALRRQVGDYRGIAADANNLGLVAVALGDEAEAQRRHTEALITAREHGFDDAAAAALVNLGALASENGDDVEAESRYTEALALYRSLADPADEALVLHDLGLLEVGRGNYSGAAGRYQSSLAILDRTGPVSDAVAVRRDLALVFAAMGILDRAERQLNRAELLAREGGLSPAAAGRLRLAHGDLALQFNRLTTAREAYDAGLALLRRAKDPAGEADALAALGALSLMTEDYTAARGLLTSAASRQQALGDGRSAALTRLLAAKAARELGDTAAARHMVATALDTLRQSGDRVAEAWALCQNGDLQRSVGLPLSAETAYRRGLERLGRRPVTEVAVCLYGGLAGVLRTRGAGREAIEELDHGIAAVEAAADRVSAPGRRGDFLADKWQLYTDLALAQRAAGSDSSAFETSEHLRARQTLDLIGRGPGAVPPSAGADARVLALRRRITALMDVVATEATNAALRGAEELQRLPNQQREALTQAEDAYADLLDSLDRNRPVDHPGRSIATPGWREVAARLPPGEALIEYLVTDSAALAFVVTSDRLAAVDLPVTGAELETEVDFVRGALAQSRAAGGTAWLAPLRRLRAQLVTPIEAAGLLRDTHRLLIVPQGQLHYLPFAALLESGAGGQFLIQRYDIGYVSSAAVWLTLTNRTPRPGARGILALAPRTRELPGANAEVAAIAAIYGADAVVLTGARATRRALGDAAPAYGIIHLATLGVLNKHNPLFSFVALAPSTDSDGRLEVHDVFDLSLRARLVVLSACQTALGSGRVSDVPPGDDWVGLVQAFQSAGAATVLATLWPVDDAATAQLMRQFYRALRAGSTEAEALAAAQRSALSHPASRSPFYWAGFVLDGSL